MEFQSAMNDMNGGEQEQPTAETTPVVRFGEVSEITLQAEIANRVKRKAKRRGRVLAEMMPSSPNGKAPDSPTKMKAKVKDRHSRTGRRGLPKKGVLCLCSHCQAPIHVRLLFLLIYSLVGLKICTRATLMYCIFPP